MAGLGTTSLSGSKGGAAVLKPCWKPLRLGASDRWSGTLVLGSGPVDRPFETGLEVVLILTAFIIILPLLGHFLAWIVHPLILVDSCHG